MKNEKLGASTKSIKSDYKWTLRTLGVIGMNKEKERPKANIGSIRN